MKEQATKVLIITAPSGSGKSTIINRLLAEEEWFGFSISATTRSPRGKEEHGKEYYFIPTEDFKTKIEERAFLEWEMVYEGLYYGTFRSELDRIREEGKYPLLDIDVQGALRLKEEFGEHALSLFIKAPSIAELERRLKGRATDSEEEIAVRIQKAEEELSHESKFDVVVVNDDLEQSYQEVLGYIKAFLEL